MPGYRARQSARDAPVQKKNSRRSGPTAWAAHANDRHHPTRFSSIGFWPLLRQQMPLCAAMVNSVSASCVKVTPSRFNSSSVSLQASALAMAVMEAVHSHEFTRNSPHASICAAGQYVRDCWGLVRVWMGRPLIPGRISLIQNKFQIPVANGQNNFLRGVNMPLLELLIQPNPIQAHAL